jgi:hypothetical protein
MIGRHLRFGIATGLLYPLTWLSLLLGGWGLALAPAVIFLGHAVLDNRTAPDTASYADLSPRWTDALLYAHLPCAAVTLLLTWWQAAPGDMLGIGAQLAPILGGWVIEAHESYGPLQLVAATYVAGLMLSTNTIAGHELVHRHGDRGAMLAGRWLLAANGDAQFSISHVYGHHLNVGLRQDPATARRGETLFRFVVRSAAGQYREALEIERRRLAREGKPVWSHHNRLLRSAAMTAAIALTAFWLAGAVGVLVFAGTCVVAKFLFENVNYIEHYGLVRAPGTRVEPRHSWDCHGRGATLVFYNLSRHAHHHTRAVLPYRALMPTPESECIQLERGYIVSMFMAVVPPLWFRYTTPKLIDWDRRLASPQEREIAKVANHLSKYPPLMAATLETTV